MTAPTNASPRSVILVRKAWRDGSCRRFLRVAGDPLVEQKTHRALRPMRVQVERVLPGADAERPRLREERLSHRSGSHVDERVEGQSPHAAALG